MTVAADNGDVVARLRPMSEAKKDGTPVLALLRSDLITVREDLRRLHGLWVVVRNRGELDEWGLAGPFGYGGLPDEWFVGYEELPPDRLRSLQAVPEGLTFAAFARANRERCESPQGFNHDLGSWTASDWVTAIVGELGEAANIVKKLNRYRDNIPGNKETADALRAKLRREIGDTFVYLDLLCQSLGFVVSEAAVEVFNAKSEEIGYPVVLSASPAPPVASGWQPMGTAPKDGTHFIGNTQWGAREIWWHKDTYEGEYWTDEGDSEPEPTGWIPLPGAAAPQTTTEVSNG